MISAILAAKALKKLRGGEMFSVGAKPFNSAARQVYGGWTLAEAGENPWANHVWHTMSAKYNPDLIARADSKAWLKGYKELPRDLRRKFAREGRPYWNRAILPGLTPEQKAEIFNAFEATPLTADDAWQQLKANTLRRAPYPAIPILNTWPYTTAPRSAKVENMQDIVSATSGDYRRTLADMWTAARRGRRQANLDLIAARRQQLWNRWVPAIPADYANIPAPPAVPSDEQRARVIADVNRAIARGEL